MATQLITYLIIHTKSYKLIAIELSKQQALKADKKLTQKFCGSSVMYLEHNNVLHN